MNDPKDFAPFRQAKEELSVALAARNIKAAVGMAPNSHREEYIIEVRVYSEDDLPFIPANWQRWPVHTEYVDHPVALEGN